MEQMNTTTACHPSFGELLKYHRNNLNMTRDQLSDGICSSRYIFDLERGDKHPTLFMINQLCDKLHINLYDEYSLILLHHDLDTHKRILKLNNCVADKDIETVRKLINEYKDFEAFQFGEPHYILTYFRTLDLLYNECDIGAAVDLAYNTLKEAHPELERGNQTPLALTNGELQLFYIAASYSIDVGKIEQAKYLYAHILSYLKKELSDSHYVVNRNRHFEINMYTNVYYNYFSDFHETGEYLEEYLDFLLDFQKNSKNETNQAKLFFCKAYILLHRGDKERAKIYYYAAYYNGLLLLGEETVTSIQDLLFPDGNPFHKSAL